jgi:hypothetical protein
VRQDDQENPMQQQLHTLSTFVNLLTCLSMIQDSDKFDAKTKQEANVLLKSLLKFETILTAFTYLYIFETTALLQVIYRQVL